MKTPRSASPISRMMKRPKTLSQALKLNEARYMPTP